MVAVKLRTLAVVLSVLLLTAYSLTWLHERTLTHSGNTQVFWLKGENVTSNGSNLSSILGDLKTLGFVEREVNGSVGMRVRYIPRALWATAGQCRIEGPLLITLSPNQTVMIKRISVRATLAGDGWTDEI
ncbi:MAG: hypothetical protein ABGW50_04525, partial [Thermococcus sp.]